MLGPAPAARVLIEAAGELGVPISHADPHTHGFAPVDAENVVLVRPDQHIAWVGQPSGPSKDPMKDPRTIIKPAISGFAPLPGTTNA